MVICYLDAFAGISGDMTVGALLDAGADFEAVRAALESLGTGAVFRLERTKRRGIAAAKFIVEGGETRKHRHLPHIVKMIGGAALPERARANAIAVFERLGAAEAKVHGVPIEKVHFHEVGAVDSICDIVAACLALELLGVEEVHCSPLNVGSGVVSTEHGVLPVPAPATAELLAGIPVYARGPAMELTTPTGAALVATLARSFGPVPPMRIRGTGYGAGDNDVAEHPNVLRAVLGEAVRVPEAQIVWTVEANIDDATPQVLGYAMDRLFAAGALDVTFTPAQMKKNRPGVTVSVLCRPEQRDDMAAILFAETPTLGVRMHESERRVRERRMEEVETPYGKIRVKVSGTACAPEFEDCRSAAEASGAPLREVINQAILAWLKDRR